MPADQSDSLRDQLRTALGAAYTLERELGGGGMARVFLAHDETLDRSVVVKVLAPELAEGLSAERFVREMRFAARLQEPHLVPVLASGTTSKGLPYYTMPFVRGESLRARIRGGPIALEDATSILCDVAQALAYAHQQGVVHRDIKPENVLLSDGTAVVTDFGIAKAVGASRTRESDRDASGMLTRLGTSLGTPAYMAPEQASGDDVDHRADLYAWGVVAYEILAHGHPFAGRNTAQQLIAAHIGETPRPLSTGREHLPPALAALVMSCLEKDPASRPQSADALVTVLKARDVPTLAPRRSMLAAGALVVLVVVGGTLLIRSRTFTPPGAPTTASAAVPANGTTSRFASSLAVLPLANYSRDPAQDYFADGMTDELTTTLSKLEALRVIAHRSVLRFKRSEQSAPEIARSLGVKYLVDGSVLQDGNRVRISATLVDAETNAPLWSQTFDRERRDVIALQREVALAIAREIAITLTPQDRSRLADTLPVDPVAFDLYIKGTQARYKAFGASDRKEAKGYFERAIARSPKYAPAYAGLASIQAILQDGVGARRSAEMSRALDPTLAEAPMVLGMVSQLYDKDWAGAEAAFRQAIRLNPGSAEAHHELSMLLMRVRRFDEALREAQLTVYLAPMTARFEQGLAAIQLFSGHYDEAIVTAHKALSRDSTYTAPYAIVAHIYALQGKLVQVEDALARCDPQACSDIAPSLLGYAYAVSGRRAEALRIVDTLTKRWRVGSPPPGLAFGIARIFAGLAERERALDWLERENQTSVFMLYAGIDPVFRPLYGQPRFSSLLKRLGLPEPT